MNKKLKDWLQNRRADGHGYVDVGAWLREHAPEHFIGYNDIVRVLELVKSH